MNYDVYVLGVSESSCEQRSFCLYLPDYFEFLSLCDSDFSLLYTYRIAIFIAKLWELGISLI